MHYDQPNVKSKTTTREILSNFKGLDSASPVYAVDKSRATAMRNFIAENGSNHKRPGWKQIARFKDANGNDQAINGYFRFTVSKQEYRIVYAGTTFYIYNDKTDEYVDIIDVMTINGKPDNMVDKTRLVDRPIQMFVYGERVYFIGCGDYLVFEARNGLPELRRVQDDEITYIPRTTTNIGPNEIEKDADGNIIEYALRQTDRDVNVLNKWRINELIGSEQATENDLRTYTLDTDNIDATGITVECYDYKPTYSESDSSTIIEYTKESHTLKLGNATTKWLSESSTADREPIKGDNLKGKTVEFDTTIISFGTLRTLLFTEVENVLKSDNLTIWLDGGDKWNTVYIKAKITKNGASSTLVLGYASRSSILTKYTAYWNQTAIDGITLDNTDSTVSFVSNKLHDLGIHVDGLPSLTYELKETGVVYGYIDLPSGKLALCKPMRPLQGESNIKVKFAKSDVTTVEKILNSSFGAYFGATGNANTLFLSGNANSSNMDFWSEAEDFTYFPSGNVCIVGTPNTAIKGYMRLGDDTLAILKEESRNEPTLYVRSGVAPEVSDDNVIKTGYYYTRGKYITHGSVSSESCRMLAGDPLFLSKSGVYGIVMTDNVAVEQRVARERSRFINSLLSKHKDLSKATAIVYDNRYYLAIDEVIYIADARYKHTTRGDMPDTFNYEWWYWDNCPVREFYVIDDQLCFGTADGRICVFDKEFTDRKYEKIGSVSPNFIDNTFAYNTTVVTLKSGDFCYLKGNAFRLFMSGVTIEDGKIKIPSDFNDDIYAGQEVYVDTVGESGLETATKYIIDQIDDYDRFTLADSHNNAISLSKGGFRLLIRIDGEIVKADINDNLLQLRNAYSNALYTIAIYNDEVWNVALYKYVKTNVVAEWYTPVMDMGTNDYIKTLTRLTLATEQITNGQITFGWETKNSTSLVDVDSEGLDVFDFGNLDFSKFSFNTGFSSSYTRDVKVDFNFIIFRFVSDNDCDCCVYSFTITYKINRRNKGVF